MNYKPIPETFRKYNSNFRLIKREGDVVIYVRGEGGPAEQYEVMKVRRHEGLHFAGGVATAPSEYLPSASEWGDKGFTFKTLPEAESRMSILLSMQAARSAATEAEGAGARPAGKSLISSLLNKAKRSL